MGVSSLFAAAPAAYLALKVVGGLSLLWLGQRLAWEVARRHGREVDFSPAAPMTGPQAFRLGLATNLANPKSALFVASLFAAALMVSISTAWYLVLALLLSSGSVGAAYLRARPRLTPPLALYHRLRLEAAVGQQMSVSSAPPGSTADH